MRMLQMNMGVVDENNESENDVKEVSKAYFKSWG